MRALTTCIAAAAMMVTATSALAQSQSTEERVLRSVLDSLLPPAQEPEEEEAQVPQPAQVSPPAALTPAQRMQQVLASPHRAEDAPRDRYRHPAETLDFFRVEPGMTVADFMPASGWYSRVLIPFLGSEGTYIGVDPWLNEKFGGYWNTYRETPTRLPGQATQWVPEGGARVVGVITDDVPEELQGTVDRFLIFREVHNMRRFGWFHEVAMTARSLLKDDGLLGVVQHRARRNAPVNETFGDKGYQHEEDVIALFELHGFELVGSSPVNNNRADPSDFEVGVWALPPNFVGTDDDDEDRRAYLQAIGESDRMTLLFRKRS
jgi:predicted methyltransferase